MNKTGFILSDLHLLTNRTSINLHIQEIEQAASYADLFILNGDIFDFKWSLHGGISSSLEAARQWIETLISDWPHCHFLFIIGNHDNLTAYMRLLEELSCRYANMSWEKYFFKLEDKVFLHGDVADDFLTPDMLDIHRMRWDRHRQAHPFWNSFYGVATRYSPHWIVPKLKSRRACARRISFYLKAAMADEFDSIHDIYFGHIHLPFTDFSWKGLHFHNTGAAIQGLRMRVLPFSFKSSLPAKWNDSAQSLSA